MTILLSFAGGALLVYAAAKLGLFEHLAPNEYDLWPNGADETLGDALVRAEAERTVREIEAYLTHPSGPA